MDKHFRGKTRKPLIGVTPLFDDERGSIWMLPGYMDGVRAAGGLPVILPFAANEDITQIIGMIDGLMLAGGHDVDPALYGEAPIQQCEAPNKARDSLEYALLSAMLEADKPVFGICRGIQILNAYLGGTLYQDIPSQLGCSVCHSAKGSDVAHVVEILDGTPLSDTLGKAELTVNSYHHQSIKRLSGRLLPMARSDDGLIEAAYMPDRQFVVAVQWHPELTFSGDADEMKLFSAFVSACG